MSRQQENAGPNVGSTSGNDEEVALAEEHVKISSAGLKLSATVRVPDGVKAGEKRGAAKKQITEGIRGHSGRLPECESEGASPAR